MTAPQENNRVQINNIVFCGYFWCEDDYIEREDFQSYPFGSTRIKLSGRSVWLSISKKDICKEIFDVNLCDLAQYYLEKIRLERQVNYVTLQLSNIHYSFTLNCSKSRLLTDVIAKYQKEFEIDELKIAQEAKSKETPIPVTANLIENLKQTCVISVSLKSVIKDAVRLKRTHLSFHPSIGKTHATLIIPTITPFCQKVINFCKTAINCINNNNGAENDVLQD